MVPSWYDEADAYDLAFSYPATAEIGFLRTIFEREGVSPPAFVLEPMVGSGRLIPGLEQLGYCVIGFDRSRPMLALARRRSAQARLFQGDAARFAVHPRCGAAHCLIDSFRYLLSADDARRFLDLVAGALRPGAPFVLGLELAGPGPRPAETWTATRDGRAARATIVSRGSAKPDVEWMEATVEVRDGSSARTVKSRLAQRVWTPSAFLDLLDGCEAFEVRSLHLRDHDPDHFLEGLPRDGGPVIVVLSRTGAGTRPGSASTLSSPGP